jgi:hypothetical protein
MNTKTVALMTTVGAVALVALLFAYPTMAASSVAPHGPNLRQLMQQSQGKSPDKISLSIGQTVTLTSVAGGYRELGNPMVNGTATDSLALKVTGAFKGGYALSVTSGTISFNGTTYTVSAGSAELGPYGVHMVGQGQAGSSAQFLFEARDLGKFGAINYGVLRIDLTNGSSEFGIRLLVTVST